MQCSGGKEGVSSGDGWEEARCAAGGCKVRWKEEEKERKEKKEEGKERKKEKRKTRWLGGVCRRSAVEEEGCCGAACG